MLGFSQALGLGFRQSHYLKTNWSFYFTLLYINGAKHLLGTSMFFKKNWCSLASLFSSFVIPFLAPLLCYSFLCCSLFHYFALLFLDSMFPFSLQLYFATSLHCYSLLYYTIVLLLPCFTVPLLHCTLWQRCKLGQM